MGWLDDLQVKAQELASEGLSDINQYLATRVNSVVKVGPPPQGNLTPAQVEAGKAGAPKPIAAPEAAESADFDMSSMAKFALPAIAIGVAAFYFSKKKG